jgi:hypothetical protein
MTVPGIGPLIASAMVAAIANGVAYPKRVLGATSRGCPVSSFVKLRASRQVAKLVPKPALMHEQIVKEMVSYAGQFACRRPRTMPFRTRRHI